MSVGIDWVYSALTKASSNKDYVSNKPVDLGEVAQKKTTAEPLKPIFLILGAPRAETMLLQLSLKSRANLEIFFNQQILSQISHLGVRNLLEKAEQVYRQDVNKFDRLTSLLIDYVDHPELLFSTSSFGAADFDVEKENRMIADCCKRIRQTFLKEQAKKIALGINKNDTEKMKEIVDLQRNRISLNKIDKS